MIEYKKVKKENYTKFYGAAYDNIEKFRDPPELSRGGLIVWDEDFEEYVRLKLRFSIYARNLQGLLRSEPIKLRFVRGFLENKNYD